jgi:hypothetical protein
MRTILLAGMLCLPLLISSSAQQPSPSPSTSAVYVRPEKDVRVKRYFMSMFGPTAIGIRAARAGISTWDNSPVEWGPHWDGFGKRFASGTGESVIRNTAIFGLDEAFKLDSHYYRSSGGFGSKVKNAITSPLLARNRHGKKVFGFPATVGRYAAPVISNEAWFPARYSWKDGLRTGTYSFGTDVLFNLVKEFIHR